MKVCFVATKVYARRGSERILAPSYDDTSSLLAREFAHCDTLYLLRDELGVLLSFIMVAWETVEVEGQCLPALFAGLGSTRQEEKERRFTGPPLQLLHV